jgi:hypothetical protein
MGCAGKWRSLSTSRPGRHDWSADGACLATGLEIAATIPTSANQRRLRNLEPCQVCWRTMRWHNGRTRRSLNPNSEEVLRDCLTNGERSAAHPILARSLAPTKAEYICADQRVTLTFRLQHGGGPYIPSSRVGSDRQVLSNSIIRVVALAHESGRNSRLGFCPRIGRLGNQRLSQSRRDEARLCATGNNLSCLSN